MILLESKWSFPQGKTERTWLADDESELTADFDPTSAAGSSVIVIGTGAVWMKNTKEKWQKMGTTEVLA